MHYTLELKEEYKKYINITEDKVYFNNQVENIEIAGADPKTFKVLTFNWDFSWLSYAKDKNNAYFFILRLDGGKLVCRKINSKSIESFEVLEDYYARDNDYVYYMGRKKADSDPKTFEILDLGYTKDINNVYYNGKKIEGADPKTFIAIPKSNKYGIDKNHVYWCGILSDESKTNLSEDDIQNFIYANKNLGGYWWSENH